MSDKQMYVVGGGNVYESNKGILFPLQPLNQPFAPVLRHQVPVQIMVVR